MPSSPAGLGIALVERGSNYVAMFPGAALAGGLRRKRPAPAEKTVVPVASGLIAGDSPLDIVSALLIARSVIAA